MPLGRRMPMHHRHAAKTAAPLQERLVDPRPVIAAELREGCGEGGLGRDGGIDPSMHEDRIPDPNMTLEMVKAREHLFVCRLAYEFTRERCIAAAGHAAQLVDKSLAVDAHPSVVCGLRAAAAPDG